MNNIEVKNITKYYDKECALQDITLQFVENKIYGLLGRNGAGKSTLLNIISNRIFACNGSVFIDGENIINNDFALNKLFLVNDKNQYPKHMKIKNIYEWTKQFYPEFDLEYAQHLSKEFSLDVNKSVKSLSTGYTSVLKIILALSVNTPYLLLDEPTLGLDANHRDLFYRLLIEKYSENPCTIIISTHLIDEITNVIEEIVIIDQGKIIRNESTEDLLSQGYTISGPADAIDAYIAEKKVLGVDTLGGLKTAYIIGIAEDTIPSNLEQSRMELQKLFIQMTSNGEELR